ncbi:MAG: hypothetical protein Q9186_006217 [Xanthomendoza sp. 1 TL-2023]
MSIQRVLVQWIALLLSLTNLSCTTPITPALGNLNPALLQTLPQCLRYNTNYFPNKAHDKPITLSLGAVTERAALVRAANPELIIRFFYCPELPVQHDAASRTLYGALRALTPRLNSEGYNAPLDRRFATEEERGVNCLFSITDQEAGGKISVGAVVDVVNWIRRYMLSEGNLGSMSFAIYMDDAKVATGYIRPRHNPPGLVGSSWTSLGR